MLGVKALELKLKNTLGCAASGFKRTVLGINISDATESSYYKGHFACQYNPFKFISKVR